MVVSVTKAVIIIRKFSKRNPQFTTMGAMLHMVWLIVSGEDTSAAHLPANGKLHAMVDIRFNDCGKYDLQLSIL